VREGGKEEQRKQASRGPISNSHICELPCRQANMCCTILNGSKSLPTLSSSSAAAVVVSWEKTLNLGLVLPAHNKSTSSQELGLCLKRRRPLRSGRRKNWVHHFHGPAAGGLLTKRFLSKLNDSLPSTGIVYLYISSLKTLILFFFFFVCSFGEMLWEFYGIQIQL